MSVITALAAVALGYGIPYTFVSGFETAPEDAEEAPEVLEGGVEADVLDAAEEKTEDAAGEVKETAEETAGEVKETAEDAAGEVKEAAEDAKDAAEESAE